MALHNLNFIPRTGRLRLLQVGTFVAVMGCLVLGSALLTGAGSSHRTAAIADSVASASASASPRPGGVSSKPKSISDNPTTSAALGTSPDTVRYYEQTTGKSFVVNLRTLKTDILSEQRLSGFLRSWWVPRADRVVSSFQQSDGVAYRFYDYDTHTTTTIGSAVAAVAISPDGLRTAYLQHDGDALSLWIGAVDGTSAQKILKTRVDEPQLSWPQKNALSLVSRRADRPGFDLSLVGTDGTLVPVLTNKENLEAVWSPDASRLLYSFFTPDVGVSLWVHDATTGVDAPLGLPTSAEKCAWHPDGAHITCGVPVQSSLTRDVPADHTATIDDIVTLDLVTGDQHRLYGGTSASLISVIDPLVSSSGSSLVFTNLFDQRLYVLSL